MKKLNKKSAIQAATTIGGATAGFVAIHTGSKFIPSKFSKFVAPAEIAAGAAMVALVDNDLVKAAGAGIALHGIIKGINALTAPTVAEDGSVTPATGIKAMIGSHMPQLNGFEASALGYADVIDAFPSAWEQQPLQLNGGEVYNDGSSYASSNMALSLVG